MSEDVTLYSSYPLPGAEIGNVIKTMGGKAGPPKEKRDMLGSVRKGKRCIMVYGSVFPETPEVIWENCIQDMGKDLAEEMTKKLGGKPQANFMIELGHAPKSGLLAVEFAYQCALRWPCVVQAEVYEQDNFIGKVYTKEDMERLLAEGKAFTTYGMDLEEEEDEE